MYVTLREALLVEDKLSEDITLNKYLKLIKKHQLIIINLAIIMIVVIAFLSFGKNKVITVSAIAMNVRTGPGIESEISTQVQRGDKLVVLKEEKQWYQVRLQSRRTGWVASWLFDDNQDSPATNQVATVNTADTKLRKDPNTDGEEIQSLKKGKVVTITSEQNGWSNVTVGKKHGWIFSELLTLGAPKKNDKEVIDADQLYAREEGTKVRSTPSIDGAVVATLKAGAKLSFKQRDGLWYQVETEDGQTGYVANWVVSFEEPGKNTKKASSLAETTIVLDPGHGGSDVGAQSNDETISEKIITLATAHYVEASLKELGANVILTRDDDSLVELGDIALISNRKRADAFISFHYDSTEISNEASGFTTYFYDDKDKTLAETLNRHLEKELPLPNRGVEKGDYQVIRENERPAILLELGYMNNDNDAHTFKTKKFQRQVATAVINALDEYFSK